jgi:hypothetical protein
MSQIQETIVANYANATREGLRADLAASYDERDAWGEIAARMSDVHEARYGAALHGGEHDAWAA